MFFFTIVGEDGFGSYKGFRTQREFTCSEMLVVLTYRPSESAIDKLSMAYRYRPQRIPDQKTAVRISFLVFNLLVIF